MIRSFVAGVEGAHERTAEHGAALETQINEAFPDGPISEDSIAAQIVTPCPHFSEDDTSDGEDTRSIKEAFPAKTQETLINEAFPAEIVTPRPPFSEDDPWGGESKGVVKNHLYKKEEQMQKEMEAAHFDLTLYALCVASHHKRLPSKVSLLGRLQKHSKGSA